MRRLVTVAGVVVVVATGAACSALRENASPVCLPTGSAGVILSAQSVPTASRLPCIAGYPAGWGLSTVRIRSGLTSFTLDSDRAGGSALHVTLRRRCDVGRATEVPSDEPGTRRYERILSIENGFRGVRTYLFDGGCATYEFQFAERAQALVNEASLAVSFVTRAEVAAFVERDSHGELHL